MTDRARPGLVALYDIRPGNRAGQFLQPRSLHGAINQSIKTHLYCAICCKRIRRTLGWTRQSVYVRCTQWQTVQFQSTPETTERLG